MIWKELNTRQETYLSMKQNIFDLTFSINIDYLYVNTTYIYIDTTCVFININCIYRFSKVIYMFMT